VPEPDVTSAVLDRLDAERHDLSLDALPEDQRRALELRVVDELDYAEIGNRLAITPEGARTRVFRALGTLRAQIGRSGT
jgi:RNA polymerase sigma-70 factor (ECF subfamily)